MMDLLDDLSRLKKIDSDNVLKTVELFPKQCQQAWQDVKKVKIPKNYRAVQNIVINGMGGSGLGGHIFFSLFYDRLKIPLRVIHGYRLPAYVNEKTLCILASYSGTTEEIITAYQEARKRRAKILGITTGGVLQKFFEANRLPYYLINPIYNPSGQPRLGVGYAVLGTIGLLKRCGLIFLKDKEVEEMVLFLERQSRKFAVNQKTSINPVKKIAEELKGKIVVNVAAEFLSGNVHTLTNQLNESSKNFAVFFLIPELNHHLLEGLAHPSFLPQSLRFLFIKSMLYQPKIKKRLAVTKKVVEKNKIEVSVYKTCGGTKFLQSFEILHFGGYLNYYLAVLNKVNPLAVPWVDYFKEELKN